MIIHGSARGGSNRRAVHVEFHVVGGLLWMISFPQLDWYLSYRSQEVPAVGQIEGQFMLGFHVVGGPPVDDFFSSVRLVFKLSILPFSKKSAIWRSLDHRNSMLRLDERTM